MKALTLTQPYASLVALGEKRFETRNWATDHRGPLAIHAAAGLAGLKYLGEKISASQLEARLQTLCRTEPFRTALLGEPAAELPRGVVVAVVELTEIHVAAEIRDALEFGAHEADPQLVGPVDRAAARRELAFGDFSHGRHAWRLERNRPLEIPFPARGEMGLWTLWEGVCRGCGCTELAACEEGCHWVEADLCSACAPATVQAAAR